MAPIRPLAWEHPYATGATVKRQKKKKKKKKKKKSFIINYVFVVHTLFYFLPFMHGVDSFSFTFLVAGTCGNL